MTRATLYSDGGSRGNPGPAAIGYVLTVAGEKPIEHGATIGAATNNVAEYQALIMGLERALKLAVTELDCFLDSELVVKQLNGDYRVKNNGLKPLAAKIHGLIPRFSSLHFSAVPREQNKRADWLVNQALDKLK